MGDVLFGVVTDTADEEKLGRVKVKLLDYSGEPELPWIRVAQPIASLKFGTFLLPEKEDHVVILQGPGGVNGMVVIGSLYSGVRLPFADIAAGTDNNLKHFKSRAGIEIIVDDTDGAELVKIVTPEGVYITFDNAAKTLEMAGPELVNILTDADCTVTAAAVTVTGSDTVTIEGGEVTVTADKVTIDSGEIALAP